MAYFISVCLVKENSSAGSGDGGITGDKANLNLSGFIPSSGDRVLKCEKWGKSLGTLTPLSGNERNS